MPAATVLSWPDSDGTKLRELLSAERPDAAGLTKTAERLLIGSTIPDEDFARFLHFVESEISCVDQLI